MKSETLVLLPGLVCDHRLFAAQIAHFGAEYAVLVPRLEGASTIVELACQVLEQVDASQFSLAGLSMGGIVAMHIASASPERVKRLALLDTNHLADTAERKAERDRQIARARSGFFQDVVSDELIPHYLAEANQCDPHLHDTIFAMAMDCGVETFVSQTLALREREDSSAFLRCWDKPTLVLCGAEDRLCTPQRHDEIENLLANNLRINVEGAGHMVTMERPVETNKALENWLRM